MTRKVALSWRHVPMAVVKKVRPPVEFHPAAAHFLITVDIRTATYRDERAFSQTCSQLSSPKDPSPMVAWLSAVLVQLSPPSAARQVGP